MSRPLSRDCLPTVPHSCRSKRSFLLYRSPRGVRVPDDTVVYALLISSSLVHFRDPHPGLDGPIANPATRSYTGRTMAAEDTPLALCYGGEEAPSTMASNVLIILYLFGKLPKCHTRVSCHSALASFNTLENPRHGFKLARWLPISEKHW